MFWIAAVMALVAIVLGRLLPAKGNPSPLANRLAYQIGSGTSAILLAGLALLAPDWSKGLAVAVGAVLGLALAWATEWFEWPESAAMPARLGALVLLLVGFCLIWSDPVVVSYALGGLSASLGAAHLFAVLYGQSAIGTGGLLGMALLATASLSWLPRLLKAGTEVQGLWLLTLAAAAVGTAATAWAWPRRPVATALAGGTAAVLVTALAPRYASLVLPINIVLPTLVGAVVAVIVTAMPERQRQGLATIALSLLAILAMMVALRLGGTAGLAFFGLGLLPILGLQPTAWGTALLVVVGGRAVLQLWLDRTALATMGLDLTHTYGFAGLIAGCLLAVVTAQVHEHFQARRIVLLPLGWGLLAVPLLLGYLLHVEPLGTFVVGLLTVSLVWGLLRQPGEPTRTGEFAPALAGIGLSTALLAAPWLVSQINAPRGPRIVVFLVALALVTAFVIAATRRLPTRTESMIDAD
jgi:hypothetical protein